MKLIPFSYFTYAGPNDFVVFSRAGREKSSGRGLAGFLLLGTSVVVVPLGVKIVNWSVVERSQDGQRIRVSGEMVVVNTEAMLEYFDFSVYPDNGIYRNDPTAQVEDQVRIAVRAPIRAQLAGMTVADISSNLANISSALDRELAAEDSELMKHLKQHAIKVQSISVQFAEPEDEDLSEALGATEREALLAAMDDAVADRRLRAAEKDREVRKYEEETTLELVKDEAERIQQEGENVLARAKADADAMVEQLKPFADMDASALLAHALMKAADRGLRSVSIDPGLMAAIKGAAKEDV